MLLPVNNQINVISNSMARGWAAEAFKLLIKAPTLQLLTLIYRLCKLIDMYKAFDKYNIARCLYN